MVEQQGVVAGLILIVFVAASMATVGCVDNVDADGFNVEESGEALLEIEPQSVDFGEVELHSEASEVVTVENTGDTAVAVDDIRFRDDGEYFESHEVYDSGSSQGLDDHPEGIDGGDTVLFEIRYAPTQEGQHETQWSVEADGEAYPITVSGQGVDEGCPVAEASIVTGDDTAVQTGVVEVDSAVELSAAGSHDPDGGSIASYQWTVLESPGDHNMADISDREAEHTELTVFGVGDYVIEATVVDDQGRHSCESAVVELEAMSESTIRVEVSWSATETDDQPVPVDMDMHYLHSQGQWGGVPWDVNFGNPEPNDEWDDGSEVQLKYDSLHDRLPETLTHNHPDPDHYYSAAVYYYDDPQEVGAADVQMRIFSDGVLWLDESRVLEDAGPGMVNAGDFWHVADIETQRDEVDDVTIIDELSDDQGISSMN